MVFNDVSDAPLTSSIKPASRCGISVVAILSVTDAVVFVAAAVTFATRCDRLSNASLSSLARASAVFSVSATILAGVTAAGFFVDCLRLELFFVDAMTMTPAQRFDIECSRSAALV